MSQREIYNLPCLVTLTVNVHSIVSCPDVDPNLDSKSCRLAKSFAKCVFVVTEGVHRCSERQAGRQKERQTDRFAITLYFKR
jgi:hypothetical protein